MLSLLVLWSSESVGLQILMASCAKWDQSLHAQRKTHTSSRIQINLHTSETQWCIGVENTLPPGDPHVIIWYPFFEVSITAMHTYHIIVKPLTGISPIIETKLGYYVVGTYHSALEEWVPRQLPLRRLPPSRQFPPQSLITTRTILTLNSSEFSPGKVM